jgi:hypothetical protein
MILPKWYYYRAGTSDRDKVIKCMQHIPDELQQEVSDQYEKLYLMNGHIDVSEGRAVANKYLGDKARAFRGNKVQQGQVIKPEDKPEKQTEFVGYKPKTKIPKGMGIKLDH